MALLFVAITAMILALTCYTIGVWGEYFAGKLSRWHLAFFWMGLLFDSLGTHMMFRIANEVLTLSLHSLTGVLALGLMIVHALWATVTVLRNRPKELARFHRYSLVVWGIWLLAFFSGMIAAMVAKRPGACLKRTQLGG